ncbi:MAG: hypothetical protein K0R97_673, partial [Oerskovia sp.]|nr:hypothetical protein [Oerskovia sp.]
EPMIHTLRGVGYVIKPAEGAAGTARPSPTAPRRPDA